MFLFFLEMLHTIYNQDSGCIWETENVHTFTTNMMHNIWLAKTDSNFSTDELDDHNTKLITISFINTYACTNFDNGSGSKW